MLRDTMMSTMPVAMTAVEALWTERFHKFREVRKEPPETRLKNSQMTARAAIMPNSRVSTSVDASMDPADRRDGSRVTLGLADASVDIDQGLMHGPGWTSPCPGAAGAGRSVRWSEGVTPSSR